MWTSAISHTASRGSCSICSQDYSDAWNSASQGGLTRQRGIKDRPKQIEISFPVFSEAFKVPQLKLHWCILDVGYYPVMRDGVGGRKKDGGTNFLAEKCKLFCLGFWKVYQEKHYTLPLSENLVTVTKRISCDLICEAAVSQLAPVWCSYTVCWCHMLPSTRL